MVSWCLAWWSYVPGVCGAENHTRAYIVICYLAQYQCKNNQNSANQGAALKSATDEYWNRMGNEDKTIRSWVEKHMHMYMNEIIKSMSMSIIKEQCIVSYRSHWMMIIFSCWFCFKHDRILKCKHNNDELLGIAYPWWRTHYLM